jgi:hypothetical protein
MGVMEWFSKAREGSGESHGCRTVARALHVRFGLGPLCSTSAREMASIVTFTVPLVLAAILAVIPLSIIDTVSLSLSLLTRLWTDR